MKIEQFKIDPKAVARGTQEGKPFLRASSPCLCGCSPLPFISLGDGQLGITACFESVSELRAFKEIVVNMNFSTGEIK